MAKEVEFGEKLKGEKGFDNMDPVALQTTQVDQLGSTTEPLNRKNVRELARGLAGLKVYYVADTSAGSPTRKLTFQDGILIKET